MSLSLVVGLGTQQVAREYLGRKRVTDWRDSMRPPGGHSVLGDVGALTWTLSSWSQSHFVFGDAQVLGYAVPRVTAEAQEPSTAIGCLRPRRISRPVL